MAYDVASSAPRIATPANGAAPADATDGAVTANDLAVIANAFE